MVVPGFTARFKIMVFHIKNKFSIVVHHLVGMMHTEKRHSTLGNRQSTIENRDSGYVLLSTVTFFLHDNPKDKDISDLVYRLVLDCRRI